MDRLPNLPDTYDRHLLMNCKGLGSCHTLTGRVLLTMIMVSDSSAKWTKDALEQYKLEQAVATQKLLREAGQYGADVTIWFNYLECSIDGTVTMENYHEWATAALAAAGLPPMEEACKHLKELYDVKEAPVFFCVNYPGRSFALEWNAGDYFEYSVLYSEHADYRHELNHLFGATDFYFPDIVSQLADKYLPNSIMKGNEDPVTDSLTAYLIGWTDTLTPEAKAFIDETSWIDQAYLDQQKELENLTGHGSIRWGDGQYTGDLVNGVPNGQGKILWDDGNTYEGGWKDGNGHGYGTFCWNTHNCSYTGDWVAWKMHGYGTYRYADGTVLTGKWDNNEFVGN